MKYSLFFIVALCTLISLSFGIQFELKPPIHILINSSLDNHERPIRPTKCTSDFDKKSIECNYIIEDKNYDIIIPFTNIYNVGDSCKLESSLFRVQYVEVKINDDKWKPFPFHLRRINDEISISNKFRKNRFVFRFEKGCIVYAEFSDIKVSIN